MPPSCSTAIPPQCKDATSDSCSEFAQATPPSDCCMQLCRTVEQKGHLAQYCNKCTDAYGPHDGRIRPMPANPNCDYQVAKTDIAGVTVSSAPRRSTICVTEGPNTYAYTLGDTDAKGKRHFMYTDKMGSVESRVCDADETLKACFAYPSAPAGIQRINNPFFIGGSATTLLAIATIYKGFTAGGENTDLTKALVDDQGTDNLPSEMQETPPAPVPNQRGESGNADSADSIGTDGESGSPRAATRPQVQQMTKGDGIGVTIPHGELGNNDALQDYWEQMQEDTRARYPRPNQGSLAELMAQQQNSGWGATTTAPITPPDVSPDEEFDDYTEDRV